MSLIDERSRKRAKKIFRSLSFSLRFYNDVKEKGLDAKSVYLKEAVYRVKGKSRFLNSNNIEAAFKRLIKVGVLRREVDGQGLTSRIRLTPFGRQMLQEEPDLPSQKASFWEKFSSWISLNRPLR